MAYLSYERAPAAPPVVYVAGNLTIPPNTHRVQLQAAGINIRYTMDGVAVPTIAVGMLLVANAAPEWFEVEDLLNIQFIGVAAGALLDLHYYGTRLP